MQLKTAAFLSDLWDVLKTNGTVLDAVRIPLELMQRTRWFGTTPVKFSLTDWAAGFATGPVTFSVDYAPFAGVDDVFTISAVVCGDPATSPWTVTSHVDHLYSNDSEDGSFTTTSGQRTRDENPDNYFMLEYLEGDSPSVRFTLGWNGVGFRTLSAPAVLSPAISLAECPIRP